MSNKDYILVTTVSTHRIRYAMHKDDIRRGSGYGEETLSKIKECAKDLVTMEEIDEFSQEHCWESIIDCTDINEDALLALFDEENAYLKNWTREQKIKHIKKTFNNG